MWVDVAVFPCRVGRSQPRDGSSVTPSSRQDRRRQNPDARRRSCLPSELDIQTKAGALEGSLGPPRSRTPSTEAPISEDELLLVAGPSAISCAQLLVQAHTRDWRLDQRCANTTSGVVGEFVAHSIATTGTADSGSGHIGEPRSGLIAVRLRLMARSLVAQVWDNHESAPTSLSGSSFQADIEDWGYDLPHPGRRVVWCVITRQNRGIDDTVRLFPVLPRRERKRYPEPRVPVNPPRDIRLLRRVLDGLRSLDQSSEKETNADHLRRAG